ncbi:MAG: TonB-dependent receptor [Bacteroidales bacterium]
MKRFLSICSVLILAQIVFAKSPVKGFVVDMTTNEPLVGVSVYNPESSVGATTSLDGSFKLNLPDGKTNIVVSYVGYTTKKIDINSSATNLGSIKLESETVGLKDVVVTSSLAVRRKTPVALSVLGPIQIETKMGTQEFPEILKSTPGVYATKQGGGFGDSRVNIRGFEAANVAVMINGVPVNDMEWGGVYWSNWAGLGDVTRSMQVQRGLGASKVAAPSLGGSINVVTRSTDARKGGSASYGIGNDGYTKVGFTVSTGLTENKWAVTLLGTKTAGNGYIQGTEFESYSYFVNISKIINKSHQISFTAFGAPQWHNQRNNSDKLTIEEWKKQPLKYKYNASFGFDMNGQRKVSSYNVYNKPQLSLNHYWTINDKSSLSTAIYASIGNGGGYSGQAFESADRQNWYGASNGIPTTSYRSPDGTFDYDSIYTINRKSDTGSKYAMSNSINKHIWVGALSTYTTRIGDNIDLYGGLDLRYYKGIHTTELVDLYGGKFFIDKTPRPNLSNSEYLTKKLQVGDVVYRDYDGYVVNEGVFGQAEYNKGALSTFISLSGSNTSYWRYDRFYYDKANARSKTVSFLGFCAKGGANYNINANHNVFANVGIISRAPFFSGGGFVQSTTSNMINASAVNEKAISAELGYGFKSKYLTANVNLYRTNWKDKTLVRSINAQTESSLVVNMEGVDALHQGLEIDFVSKPLNKLEFSGMISLGDWFWQNNASGYLYDKQGQPTTALGFVTELLGPDHAKVDVNLKDIRVGNAAQWTAAIGLDYELLKDFKLGLDGNYFGKNFSYFNISSVGSDLSTSTYSQPWQIPDAFTFDLNCLYHFKMNGFNASLVGNIHNLLDASYIADATDGANHDYLTSSVFYGFGRTWSVSLKVKF